MDQTSEHQNENLQRYRENKEFILIILLCIAATLADVKRSAGVPLGQVCLECVFLGVIDYLREQSAKGAAAIMIGGCACWYIDSVIQNKVCTVVILGCLQVIPDMRFYTVYLMCLQMVIRLASTVRQIQTTFSLICLMTGVVAMYVKHASFWEIEDLLLLSLVLGNLPYALLEDATKCWVLYSLGVGLIWIMLKEVRGLVKRRQKSSASLHLD